MRRWTIAAVILAVVAILAAGLFSQTRGSGLPASSAQALLPRHRKALADEVKTRFRDITMDEHWADAAADIANRGWKDIRTEMIAKGATATEADGVLASARAAVKARGVYAVPVYTRRARVKSQRVWVIGFGWGMNEFGPGEPEAPNHVWLVIFGADPPHAKLGEESCG